MLYSLFKANIRLVRNIALNSAFFKNDSILIGKTYLYALFAAPPIANS